MKAERLRSLFRIALTAALAAAQGSALAGPITFNTALPISKGEAILRGQAVVLEASEDAGPGDRHLSVVAAPAVLAYGATPQLALFAVVPTVIHKSLDVTTPMGRISRGTTGLGDSTFFGRYTLLQVDRPGQTLRAAPALGLKVPTGDDDRRDRLGLLPRPLQPGSGSWDPFVAATVTWQTLAWEADADAGYRFNTEADRFEFGDVAFADASFQYRLLPRKLQAGGVPTFLYAVVETNLELRQKDRVAGRIDPDSGGFTWFLDPGLQVVARRYVLDAVVRLPAVQELGGDALGRDYEVRVGFRWNFTLPLP